MRRVILALGITAALCVGAELVVRWLVFGEGDLAQRLGKDLRRPGAWAAPLEDDYWKVRYLLRDRTKRRAFHNADEELGWTPAPIDFDAVRKALGDRRLVILFGDSYARCLTIPEECWQGLLEQSPLGERFFLLNLGVAGYGLDQTWLLLRRMIEAFADLDPLVAIGIYLDEDLDRCGLSIYRLPKPRFRLEEGELVSDGSVLIDLEEFIEAHPPSFSSWAWKLFERRVLPPSWMGRDRRWAEDVQEKLALTRALVGEIQAFLGARGLDSFFVLFHGEWALRQEGMAGWQEPALYELFRERGIRFVSSRWPLVQGPLPTETYFGGEPRIADHYNAEGNRVVFGCIEEALLGRFASYDFEPPPSSWSLLELLDYDSCTLRGEGAVARPGRGLAAPFDDAEDATRLVLRPGADGPTEVRFELAGRFRSLSALLKAGGPATSEGIARAVELVARVDGRDAARWRIESGDDPHTIELDLAGARTLVLAVSSSSDGPPRPADWIYLASPTLE